MKRCHLLRVDAPAERFAALFAALAERGERFGWLDWQPDRPPPLAPASLASAAESGALRAVQVGAGASVSVKPSRGAPRLRDVVRESFRGCLVVLVRSSSPIADAGAADRERADAPAPSLEAAGDEVVEHFVVRLGARHWRLDAGRLADRLRRPRPFRPGADDGP